MVAKIDLEWMDTPIVDFRAHAYNAGFNIDSYQMFKEETRKDLKSKTICSILRELDGIWADSATKDFSRTLSAVDRGVYVMSLDNGFSMKYPNNHSRVIYIGEGAIRNRIYNHLNNKLFDFFLSLQGIGFRFHFCEPRRRKKAAFYKDVEYDFIQYFDDKYGSFPYFNEKRGRGHDGSNEYCSKTLSKLTNKGRNIQWIIERN